MRTRTRWIVRWGGAVLGAAGAVALVAGCGGSSDPAPASADQTGLAAYEACLAKNGVVLPSGIGQRTPGAGRTGFPSTRPSVRPSGGTGGGGTGNGGGRAGGFGGFGGAQAPAGVDQATWEKATSACASVRPTFGGANAGGNNSAFTAYRNCLSEHGVTLATGAPGAAGGFGGLNTADPKVAAAVTACAPLRPSAQPRASSAPSG